MKRILFLNWRCPKNKKSGGAEYVSFELLKQLVKEKYEVVWFATTFSGAKKTEVLDGVTIVRAGNSLTVQKEARKYYQQNSNFDLIIDQYHGVPFFSFRFALCPVLFYVNETAGVIANQMLPFGLGYIYRALEALFIKLYANVPAVTISNSTTKDLRALGHKASIKTMRLACDTKPLAKLPPFSSKEKELTFIFAARLVPLKRPEEAIKMMSYLLKKEPQAKLWILGDGEQKYVDKLKGLASKLKISPQVIFKGFVSLKEKQNLMSKAHIVLITSIKEGWGLTVPEANALGTVGVTYDIAGVRDSNEHNKTGLLTKQNNPQSLAKTSLDLWHDKKKYEQLRIQAHARAKERTWQKTYQDFKEAIDSVIKK